MVPMQAETVPRNFVVPQGTTYPIRMRWLDSAGVPINLTGATIRAQLRKKFTDALPTLSFTTVNATASLDIATGFFGFDLLPAATSAIAARLYYYDIEVVTSAGDVTRAMQGTITFTPEVTK